MSSSALASESSTRPGGGPRAARGPHATLRGRRGRRRGRRRTLRRTRTLLEVSPTRRRPSSGYRRLLGDIGKEVLDVRRGQLELFDLMANATPLLFIRRTICGESDANEFAPLIDAPPRGRACRDTSRKGPGGPLFAQVQQGNAHQRVRGVSSLQRRQRGRERRFLQVLPVVEDDLGAGLVTRRIEDARHADVVLSDRIARAAR